MTSSEYFKIIIELFHQSREPEYYKPNIKRDRNSSIPRRLDDLTVLFIALNNPNNCNYYTDQPIKFEGSTTKYLDIVIQEENLDNNNFIDVKTDIGWNREGSGKIELNKLKIQKQNERKTNENINPTFNTNVIDWLRC